MSQKVNQKVRQPNILWICTDQQRSDSLACYGNPLVRTPHIDSIAHAGTRFNRHITPMQICSPSRATMMTGLYPRNNQLITNGRALPQSVPTLMTLLSNAGYRTHGVGKQHLHPLLAPAALDMQDSRAFWQKPESKDWSGPFYGYHTLDLLLGESDTAQLAGHYALWLKQNYPGSMALLKPENATQSPPDDLDEIWKSAMPVTQHYNTWISDQSAHFIDQNTDQENPFFLFVSYPDPHHPFDPPAEYADKYNPRDMPVPQISDVDLKSRPGYCDELYPKGQGFRALYWAAHENMEAGSMITTEGISNKSIQTALAYTYGMIEMIDDGVGKILQTLNAKGVDDNTIVIFTSDHGEYLFDHGLLHKGPASYRQLTEVSMLMRGPGIQKGQVINALTNHIDITPTLLQMTNVDSGEAQFDGLNLMPLLCGNSNQVRQYNFGEYHPTVREELYNQSVSTEKWRCTIYPLSDQWGELFDLENDPGERENLFLDPLFADIRHHLEGVLAEQLPPQTSVDNPLLCKW